MFRFFTDTDLQSRIPFECSLLRTFFHLHGRNYPKSPTFLSPLLRPDTAAHSTPSTKFTCESCAMLYHTSSFVRAGFCRDPYDAAGNNN